MRTLINATEAKKRSKIFQENYSVNKECRVKEAIKVALVNIDRKVRLSSSRGKTYLVLLMKRFVKN